MVLTLTKVVHVLVKVLCEREGGEGGREGGREGGEGREGGIGGKEKRERHNCSGTPLILTPYQSGYFLCPNKSTLKTFHRYIVSPTHTPTNCVSVFSSR